MANLTVRTKYVNMVIRWHSYPVDFEERIANYIQSNCSMYCYVCHNGDINSYGEVEEKHYHFVLDFITAKRLSTFLNEIADLFMLPNTNGIQIEKAVSKVKSIQYLIHKNDLAKTQHKPEEIITNLPFNELTTILDSEDDGAITYDYIMKCIRENPNKLYLIHCIGLYAYKTYRNVILDMLDEYTKGTRL